MVLMLELMQMLELVLVLFADKIVEKVVVKTLVLDTDTEKVFVAVFL